MGFTQVILTICALSNPTYCEDRHLQIAWNGSPEQCGMAQMVIAAWIGDHPDWTVKRWICDYPDKRKRDI
jgi:hypothetical protein